MERTTSRHRTLSISLIALFAALIAVGTFISIPIPGSPVPIVLQNLFALLAGLILGPAMGSAAVAIYLIIGAIGVPVFAGAVGGFVHLLGPTGGYLAGYLVCAFIAGLTVGKVSGGVKTAYWRVLLASFLGFAVIYVLGIVRLKYAISADWPKAFAVGFVPFIIGDLIKIAIAVAVTPRLRKVVAEALDA